MGPQRLISDECSGRSMIEERARAAERGSNRNWFIPQTGEMFFSERGSTRWWAADDHAHGAPALDCIDGEGLPPELKPVAPGGRADASGHGTSPDIFMNEGQPSNALRPLT